MPKHILYLMTAIIFETLGTACLKSSDGFTKLWPSIGALIGFIVALFLLSQTLRYMPVGTVYAIWSGLGIVLVALIGIFYFKQTLDFAAYAGITLILIGVIVIQVFSKSTA